MTFLTSARFSLVSLSIFALAIGACTSEAKDGTKTPATSTEKTAATSGKNPVVTMETNKGTIELELFADKAPISAANFVSYVKDGAYNGTIFHRVISTFMIQGGGFDKDLKKRQTKAPIKNESTNGLANSRGTLSMARTNAPDSGTNQFFINVKDNASLDSRGGRPGYAVFGKVTKGMDVVDAIRNVKTGACPPNFRTDCPQEPIIITSAVVK